MSGRQDNLDELRAEIAAELESVLTQDQHADDVAARIVRRLQKAFTSERIYIRSTSREERRRLVLTAWRDGNTPQQIAERHDIPIRTVYHIIRHRRTTTGTGLGSEDWVL